MAQYWWFNIAKYYSYHHSIDNHCDVNVGSLTTKTLCGFRLLNSLCKKCSLQDVNAPHCAYAGSGFWLNANSKRQAQHHVLPNCGRKQAPSSCEPTPRLPPELLPEDLWWAPSPGCPPKKEVRPVLGVKTPFWDQGMWQWQVSESGKSLQHCYHVCCMGSANI